MCMVSFIGNEWARSTPVTYPFVTWPTPNTDQVSREDLAALRAELEELRILLLAAKQFDAATNQPDCENEEKIALLKRMAEMVGVDLSDVFAPEEVS
jgi:hypothetical protein